MARIRTNNVFGTVSDNPLTSGATTLNSAGLANLAVVSGGDEAIIVLDPNRIGGAPEIVVVTAHTGSATSATITRAQFGTSARGHAQGTEWEHAPVASAGSGVGDYVTAWADYTPSNANITVGNGTQVARWCRVGPLVFFKYTLTWGSTTSFGGTVQIGLPVAQSTTTLATVGFGWAFDNSTAANTRQLNLLRSGSQAVQPNADGGTAINATVPFTWATSDVLSVEGFFEAA